jgi:hypothetical protein
MDVFVIVDLFYKNVTRVKSKWENLLLSLLLLDDSSFPERAVSRISSKNPEAALIEDGLALNNNSTRKRAEDIPIMRFTRQTTIRFAFNLYRPSVLSRTSQIIREHTKTLLLHDGNIKNNISMSASGVSMIQHEPSYITSFYY